ncbi:hypothetical protein C8J55DRAFT_556313 [Lentinula edodes]|uniref:Uncharacterized protein n=1 Tax=Lentinula lateritia TaxID=40482 RepID=A0A9W9AXK0_9AGAR|nr:hypothetical protein C8J55DRAFT_556313 [Lentinula edodes]
MFSKSGSSYISNSDLTLLGYYEHNSFGSPGGTNLNSTANPTYRVVAAPPPATSTSTPTIITSGFTNGATYTASSSAPSTAQSSSSTHRPIAGRVPQKLNNIPTVVPALGLPHPAIANALTSGPYSAAITSQISGPGNGTSGTPYDMRAPSGSSQFVNPNGFTNNSPSYGNAGPATSDRVFTLQPSRPNTASLPPGHGQKCKTIDLAENAVVTSNSSSSQIKRLKTTAITQGSSTPAPNHNTASQEQHSHPSGQSNGTLRSDTIRAGSASEQHNRPS